MIMFTQCPECKIEHKDLPGYEGFQFASPSPRCPSCGQLVWQDDFAAVATPNPPTVPQFPAENIDDLPQEQFGNAAVRMPDLPEFPGTIDLPEISLELPGRSVPPTIDLSSTAPFRLFVNKMPQRSAATSICLEVLLANRSNELLRGQLWLSDEEGRDGRPNSFAVPEREIRNSNQLKSQIVYPQIPIETGSSGHVAVRIQPVGYPAAFWQADVVVRHELNGTISVNIDKSVRGETVLMGISNDIIHINGNQRLDEVNWHELGLRLRGPKDLAVASDMSRPRSLGRHRPVQIHDESQDTPAIETARMTLSTTLLDGREAYVQLIAGKTLRLGRARTWSQKEHSDNIPNDVVLRGLATNEYDNYISRYHGKLQFAEGDVHYENLSGGGSEVGNRSLGMKGEVAIVRDNSVLRPGNDVATDKERSLGLRVRRTQCQINPKCYNLLVKDSHLESGMEDVTHRDVVTLYRTDAVGELEHYIFFQQAARVGRNATCGWRIDDPSVRPVHATLLWFDESFWIEPYSAACIVEVDDKPVPVNQVRRLTHGVTLHIAGCRFVVLDDWKQHVIDCKEWFQGHGYEEGCRCQQCINEYRQRQKAKV